MPPVIEDIRLSKDGLSIDGVQLGITPTFSALSGWLKSVTCRTIIQREGCSYLHIFDELGINFSVELMTANILSIGLTLDHRRYEMKETPTGSFTGSLYINSTRIPVDSLRPSLAYEIEASVRLPNITLFFAPNESSKRISTIIIEFSLNVKN
jgi:hypothetical protein